MMAIALGAFGAALLAAGTAVETAKGWWRHGDGGYGWVGPLFWPFAVYDINDHIIWGEGTGFWDYGYPDIYAAIFAPYGRDDPPLPPRPNGRRYRRVLRCSSSAAMTAAKLLASATIRFSRRYSRMKRSAPLGRSCQRIDLRRPGDPGVVSDAAAFT